jgi:ABC-2 type transport system ATP-binding protein
MISSHLLRDVEECCEEVLILKDGRIAAYCDLEAERRANLNFIELEIAGDGHGFGEALSQLGCEYADLGHGRFKMVLENGIGVRDLYRTALNRDVQIRKLSHRQDSLEDIFLKAMETGAPQNGSL